MSSALRSARRARAPVASIHDCATTPAALAGLTLLFSPACGGAPDDPAARGTTPCAVTFAGDAARSFLPDELQLEVLFDGFTIGEGPVWVPATAQLVVSDVAANKMYAWSESRGHEVLLEASGQTGAAPFFAGGVLGSNGAAVDAAGDIVFCQHGNRRLAKMSMGTANAPPITSLVADADGKRFNSPNDLTIAPSGEVYFSDPPYGLLDLANSDPNAGKMIFVAEGRELDKSGIYRFEPGTGERIATVALPDPITNCCFDEDEGYVYVTSFHYVGRLRLKP